MLSLTLLVLNTGLRVLELVVIAAVLTGWLGANPDNPIVRFLRSITEPLFQLVRPIARKIPGPVDWSPALVLLAIEIVQRIILS